MLEQETQARNWLQLEYSARRARNPRYSLRAFSKLLGMTSGRLSEVMSNKRSLTPRMAAQIADRLAYGPEKRTQFLQCTGRKKSEAAAPTYQQLSVDAFYALSDWWHFAILSLTEVEDFQTDPQWIARRLGISPAEVRTAIDRLTRLELLEETDGRLRATQASLTTSHDVNSAALRHSHRQSLEQAIAALEEVPIEARDISSITMAIDVSKIPEAKAMIRDFRRKLCAFLEEGKKTEVYNLNVQLVPITKGEK